MPRRKHTKPTSSQRNSRAQRLRGVAAAKIRATLTADDLEMEMLKRAMNPVLDTELVDKCSTKAFMQYLDRVKHKYNDYLTPEVQKTLQDQKRLISNRDNAQKSRDTRQKRALELESENASLKRHNYEMSMRVVALEMQLTALTDWTVVASAVTPSQPTPPSTTSSNILMAPPSPLYVSINGYDDDTSQLDNYPLLVAPPKT